MKVWEGDEVGLAEGWELVYGMADLADVDGAGERCLLCVVAVEVNTMGLVADRVCGDRRMMAEDVRNVQ